MMMSLCVPALILVANATLASAAGLKPYSYGRKTYPYEDHNVCMYRFSHRTRKPKRNFGNVQVRRDVLQCKSYLHATDSLYTPREVSVYSFQPNAHDKYDRTACRACIRYWINARHRKSPKRPAKRPSEPARSSVSQPAPPASPPVPPPFRPPSQPVPKSPPSLPKNPPSLPASPAMPLSPGPLHVPTRPTKKAFKVHYRRGGNFTMIETQPHIAPRPDLDNPYSPPTIQERRGAAGFAATPEDGICSYKQDSPRKQCCQSFDGDKFGKRPVFLFQVDPFNDTTIQANKTACYSCVKTWKLTRWACPGYSSRSS